MDKLRADTGTSFDVWVKRARKAKIADAAGLRDWLKAEHGLGSRVAGWIASAALTRGTEDYEDPRGLVDALYAGLP